MTRTHVGGALVVIAAAGTILGPVIWPHHPAVQDLPQRLLGPSWPHPFGFDELGRDELARILSGGRVSLLIGAAVVSTSAIVGALFGLVAGYLGGLVDDLIGRLIDVLLAFPGILLAIALVAVWGPSLTNVVLALTATGWVGYARLVRGQVLRSRELDYVAAARALGAPTVRVMLRHVLPAAIPAVVVQASLGMAGVMLAEAALSFLGLGVQPPTPSWGAMLSGGRAHLLDAPHLTIFPGVAIAQLVLGFSLLGDGLRDALAADQAVADVERS